MTKSQLMEGVELYRKDHNLSLEEFAKLLKIDPVRMEGYSKGYSVLTNDDALKISLLLRVPFEPELDPCPFCGGEARIIWYEDPETNAPSYAICCPDSEIALIRINNKKQESGFFAKKWDAVAAWNRRADSNA